MTCTGTRKGDAGTDSLQGGSPLNDTCVGVSQMWCKPQRIHRIRLNIKTTVESVPWCCRFCVIPYLASLIACCFFPSVLSSTYSIGIAQVCCNGLDSTGLRCFRDGSGGWRVKSWDPSKAAAQVYSLEPHDKRPRFSESQKVTWSSIGQKWRPLRQEQAPKFPQYFVPGIQQKDRLFMMFHLLGQWLNFKLFGITYLVGKIKFKLFFQGPLAKWVHDWSYVVPFVTNHRSIWGLRLPSQNSLARKMCSDGRTFEALVGGRCVLVEFPDRPLAVAALPVATICAYLILFVNLNGHHCHLFVRCRCWFKRFVCATHLHLADRRLTLDECESWDAFNMTVSRRISMGPCLHLQKW